MARRMQAVQSAVLSKVVAARPELAKECPHCGDGPLKVRTEAKRTVLLTGEAPLTARRPYLVCSACGRGHFPPGRPLGVIAE